jgi:Domain of unknown function (DUF4440)
MAEMADILEMEKERCRAELAGDLEALGSLLDDSFVYIAGSGAIIDKRNLLESRKDLDWLQLDRQDLKVRIGGDIAVITGGLLFKTRESGSPDIAQGKAFCTQVLARRDGRWLFVLQQLTRLKEGQSL